MYNLISSFYTPNCLGLRFGADQEATTEELY